MQSLNAQGSQKRISKHGFHCERNLHYRRIWNENSENHPRESRAEFSVIPIFSLTYRTTGLQWRGNYVISVSGFVFFT